MGAGFSASSANEVAGAQIKAAGLIACAVVAVLARQLQQAGLLQRLARVKDSLRELLQRVQMPGLNPDCYSAWSVDDAVQALTADFHQVPGGATQPASSI